MTPNHISVYCLASLLLLGVLACNKREKSIAELARDLKDDNAAVRASAATSLNERRSEARDVLPDLAQALKDNVAEVRHQALTALLNIALHIKGEAKAATPGLIEVLKDRSSDVRGHATTVLGLIGPEAKDAVPELVQILGDESDRIRVSAAHALGLIGGESAVKALESALSDKDHEVREAAEKALSEMQPR